MSYEEERACNVCGNNCPADDNYLCECCGEQVCADTTCWGVNLQDCVLCEADELEGE